MGSWHSGAVGSEAELAVDEVLLVRELRKLRLGWEFWAAIVEGDGYEPEDLLLDLLPLTTIEQCRRALWGFDLVTQKPTLRVISGGGASG